jgi:hypothetical protein
MCIQGRGFRWAKKEGLENVQGSNEVALFENEIPEEA